MSPPPSRPRGQHMHLDAREQARNARASGVGDQRNGVAATDQLLGERMRRDHMAAGAAGGEQEEAFHRCLFHVTT